jgi:hypothetical protein
MLVGLGMVSTRPDTLYRLICLYVQFHYFAWSHFVQTNAACYAKSHVNYCFVLNELLLIKRTNTAHASSFCLLQAA